ncbi:MAG: ABC transporter substrate-binding protein [Verrucomicrobiota bacterium]
MGRWILMASLGLLTFFFFGCDSGPTRYETLIAEKLADGLDRNAAHFEALEPYRREIVTHFPASRYATNEFITNPAKGYLIPEWSERASLRIKVDFARTQESHGPWIVAQHRGYFDQVGLDVELVTAERDDDFYQLLTDGEVEAFIERTGSRLIRSVFRGHAVTAVQSLYQKNPHIFFTLDTNVPTDQKSNAVFTPEIFPGHIIGLNQENLYYIGLLRDRWDIEPLDVKYIKSRNPNSSSVLQKRVNMTEAEMGFTSALMSIHKIQNWVHFPVEDLLSPQVSWLTVFPNAYLERNPEVIRRYNWAMFRSTLDFLDDLDALKRPIRDFVEHKRHPGFIKTAWSERIPYLLGNGQNPILSIRMENLDWDAAALLQQERIALEQHISPKLAESISF